MISTNQLFHFVQVVQNGSISKAAEKLYVAQPAISKSIKKIETDLQVKLFTLGKKKLKLTFDGERIYEIATEILASYQKLEQYRNCDICELDDVLQFYYYASPIIHEMVTPQLNVFDLFPQVHFSIHTCSSFDDFTDVMEFPHPNMFGIFLLHEEELNELVIPEDFELTVITSRQIQVITSYKNNNPIFKNDTISINDILELPFIRYSNIYSPIQQQWADSFKNVYAKMPTQTMVNEALYRNPESITLGTNIFFGYRNTKLITYPVSDLPSLSLVVLYKKNPQNKIYQRLFQALKSLYNI